MRDRLLGMMLSSAHGEQKGLTYKKGQGGSKQANEQGMYGGVEEAKS